MLSSLSLLRFVFAGVQGVCVFVFGDERGKKVAMAGLKDKTKYLQVTPEVSNDLQVTSAYFPFCL